MIDEEWKHTRRAILASDTVNLVAAIVLYFLAVGGMQGFTLTLGVTMCAGLAIIILFTHPVMEWIAQFRFFGEGHRLSGLDPEHLRATSSTYDKGREAVTDRVTGSLTRHKAGARRNAENTENTAEESGGTAADDDTEQQEGDTVDGAADKGKDGETR